MSLARHVLSELASIGRVGAETAWFVARRPWTRHAVVAQMFSVGNRSVFFILLTLGFIGAIWTLQTGFQALRILGDAGMVGEQSLPLIVRQLGPTITGLMVATRVGTGIAAELGSMVVTEQVDALRMCGAPPADYLVKPRFLACLFMVPALTMIGIVAALTTGAVTANVVFGTNPATYLNFDLVLSLDLLECVLKAFAFGTVIPIVAAASGLGASGGSEGVGEATTGAVVNACLAVIMLDFTLGGVVFLFR